MKKLFFIALIFCYANIAVASYQPQPKSSVEQLVHIMIQDSDESAPSIYFRDKTPDDYQAVYDLVKKHPELLQGIIYNGQSFAMLCIKRGYSDLLMHLINEGCLVDLTTPCNLCGLHNPQTTVLHELFGQLRSMNWYWLRSAFPEDYIEHITDLTKLIIKTFPELLDMKLGRGVETARQCAVSYNLGYLIPRIKN